MFHTINTEIIKPKRIKDPTIKSAHPGNEKEWSENRKVPTAEIEPIIEPKIGNFRTISRITPPTTAMNIPIIMIFFVDIFDQTLWPIQQDCDQRAQTRRSGVSTRVDKGDVLVA